MRSLLHHLRGRPEVAALLSVLAVDFAWMCGARLTFNNPGLPLLGTSGLLLLAIVYGHSGRSKRLSDMGYYGALFVAFGTLMTIMTYLAACGESALYDPALSKFDAFLGFDWQRWTAFLRTSPLVDTLLGFAYFSLLPQIPLTIFLLAHTDREDRNKEFFWTVFVSLLATTAVFRLFPAVGPFAFYEIELDRAVHLKHLVQLRSGGAHAYSVPQLQGLIAFPSYHTVLAVIFPYVHRGLRHTFVPSLVLNALMLVSTPSHGGHYLVDMLGGVVIAVGSIALVRYVMTRGPAMLSSPGQADITSAPTPAPSAPHTTPAPAPAPRT
jgi:membrane-associated phospholipid phosphatase